MDAPDVRLHGGGRLLAGKSSHGIEVEEVLHPLRGHGRGQLPGPGEEIVVDLPVPGDQAPHVVHELDDVCVLRMG